MYLCVFPLGKATCQGWDFVSYCVSKNCWIFVFGFCVYQSTDNDWLLYLPLSQHSAISAIAFWQISYLISLLVHCVWPGFDHILPYFYPIYFAILLTHRSLRDDSHCRVKYRQDWDRYCSLVPYRIVPYVFWHWAVIYFSPLLTAMFNYPVQCYI